MSEGKIAALLKEKRKGRGMSVKGSVSELSKRGIDISEKTLYGWESGARQPDADTFLILCDIYEIKTLSEVSVKADSAALTPPELDHIKKYRTLDGHGKETVDVVLDKEVQRMEEMRKAEEKKVLKPKATVIDLRRYWESPSAGNGNDLTDGGYDIIQVPDTLTARLASYALTVSGDSMEPDLMDGDIVLVKAQETYEVGDIVVFSKNGDSYIKYAGEHCFESANPDYPDVEIGEDDSVRCFGVVLGKL